MHLPHLPDLPVKAILPELAAVFAGANRAVLEAPPGAGKTTLVPLALLGADWLDDGKIIMLEPRRLAAKAAAQRMAFLLGEKAGETVGYRVRMEQAISAKTRIEVVTEGILTRMLQEDPTLDGVSVLIFDEFHERSLQADLGLALALDTQNVIREDLKLLVMSATLDAEFTASWLDAPLIKSEGKLFEVETHYLSPAELPASGTHPMQRVAELVPRAIRKALSQQAEGDILVFLPGLGEIKKVASFLENTLPENTELHYLHGDLSLAQQQAALNPAPKNHRKVVLATSIAETSLTIEGVKIVIDSGLARVPKFIPKTGLTTLATVPVSKAATKQRCGRAGRLGPGTCYRLWTQADQLQLPEQLNPEICDADLSSLALELAIWGIKDITQLKWLNIPPAAALAQAKDLLVRLEALSPDGKPTSHGKLLAKLGLHPRLGHLVVRGNEAGFGATAALLAALLSERDILKANAAAIGFSLPDISLRLEILAGKRPPTPGFVVDDRAVRRIKDQAVLLAKRINCNQKTIHPEVAGLLTAFAYPDRIAQLETSGKVRLITGKRAKLPTEQFSEAAFYGIAQLDGSQEARVQLAGAVTKEELLKYFSSQIESTQEVKWDAKTEKVSAKKQERLGAMVLAENNLKNPDPERVAVILLEALLAKGISGLPWAEAATKTRERLIFLHRLEPENWPDVSDEALTETAHDWLLPHLLGLKSLAETARLDLGELLLTDLDWQKRTELDKLAPTHIEVPSGSKIQVDYSDPENPVLAVRLQEIFGMLDTPRIARGRVPLLIHLLSPARRPVQVTRDLKSFWSAGYFEVRKDLRGRYPKHHWPEDPLTAQAVRGVKRRG